ncbi:hypothetical protein Agub_g2676, partial [Astrephomene gubernaculifera]
MLQDFHLRRRAAVGKRWCPAASHNTPRVARYAVRAKASASIPAPGSMLPEFSTSSPSQPWQLAVLGDLHLPPPRMQLYREAQQQLRGLLLQQQEGEQGGSTAAAAGGNEAAAPPAAAAGDAAAVRPVGRLVQLGDLGHGKHASGSRSCFEFARQYLDGFGVPYSLITGNHDLEGEEFESDEENLEAWSQVFQRPPYWCAQLGVARVVGLSTVRYRSNRNSHHEVFIPPEQLSWLEGQLRAHPTTPFIITSHAPPMGCGLKVIQEVHIKNRCAWLNHSAQPPDPDPRVFLSLVSRHPNIKLWFSAHFHLAHNYHDSISVVGSTAFVQVGVIGECNRDGLRQSRLLRGDPSGYQLLTLDHSTGALRLDMQDSWGLYDTASSQYDTASSSGQQYGSSSSSASSSPHPPPPTPLLPPGEELLCDPQAGWLCSQQLECRVGDNSTGFMTWYPVGRDTILALQAGGLLVEYDLSTAAPIGLLTRVPEGG